jgi:alpha-glucosidase
MNEPAVMEVPNKTFPMDVRHDYDGNPCSHRKAHNIYGTQMARATYHGKKICLSEKAFYYHKICLCRRNATVPLGPEIMATWEHLWIANIQVQDVNFWNGIYWV